MSNDEIKSLVWRIVIESASQGPGWAQEGVVLRKIGENISSKKEPDLKTQQMILDAWHDLFTEKHLGWGYDLDNPNSPFFHIRIR